jgi:hypothetical protein
MINKLKRISRKFGFYRLAFAPGHYASPIPDKLDAQRAVDNAYKNQVYDIDLNEHNQFVLLNAFVPIIKAAPFSNINKVGFTRYTYSNNMFGRMDGLILYSFLMHFQPKRYFEVGSGFSSALVLDANQHHTLDLNMTFIEPFPTRLNNLLSPTDKKNSRIIEEKIQDVDIEIFKDLEKNDILFLDTSHIVKTGNDVVFWLFNILPILNSGVIIHIHDIFWPFEYSTEWIEEEKCYNEIYLIRAFLMNNNDYEILFFNSFIQHEFQSKLIEIDSKLMDNSGGSIYLRKK